MPWFEKAIELYKASGKMAPGDDQKIETIRYHLEGNTKLSEVIMAAHVSDDGKIEQLQRMRRSLVREFLALTTELDEIRARKQDKSDTPTTASTMRCPAAPKHSGPVGRCRTQACFLLCA
jgi:hypothetical protein